MTSHLVNFFVTAIVVTSIALCCCQSLETQKTPVDQVVEKIVDAKDFDSLVDAVNELRKTKSLDFNRKVIDQLMLNLTDLSRIEFKPDWETDNYFHCYCGYGGRPVVPYYPRKLRMKPAINGQSVFATIQDLETKGGRCAWAIERLVAVNLPPILGGMSEAHLNETIAEIKKRVEKALEARPEVLIFLQLDVSKRAKLAEDPEIHPRTILELSRDEEAEVRRKAASNPQLYATICVQVLSRDSDPYVRHNADLRLRDHGRDRGNEIMNGYGWSLEDVKKRMKADSKKTGKENEGTDE